MHPLKSLTRLFTFRVSPTLSWYERIQLYREKIQSIELEKYLDLDSIIESDLNYFCGISVRFDDSAVPPIPFNAMRFNKNGEVREYLIKNIANVKVLIRDVWDRFEDLAYYGLDFELRYEEGKWVCAELSTDNSALSKLVTRADSFAVFWADIFRKFQNANSIRIYIKALHLSTGGIGLSDIMLVSQSDSFIKTAVKNRMELISDVVSLIRAKYAQDTQHHIFLTNIKSAIGSIMSRNGSHNIGSHVLAALSHNIGTMPDDRVLYQYIQHRMDYIATVTTGFPQWRLSAMLVGNVMKEFLSQRHLLDYIAGSEGLKAYQYHGHVVAPNQKNAIRIHIRRIADTQVDWENLACWRSKAVGSFIVYSDCLEVGDAWNRNQDVAVAIPGGVVGQHAFYTILENVIRNAAKHDWARLPEKERKGANLDLYVDFKDCPVTGKVECRVWTCVTKRNSGDKKNALKIVGMKSHDDVATLRDQIEGKIRLSFIEENGSLRKENWGMAEMRISAGYLRGSSIADIGGLNNDALRDGDCPSLEIIRPVTVDIDQYHAALGFRFDLHKPRELLVVIPRSAVVDTKTINDINSVANQYGLWFRSEDEIAQTTELSFAFVLFDRFDVSHPYHLNLPFRVIANEIISSSGADERLEIAKRIIPICSKPLVDFSEASLRAHYLESATAAEVCKDLLEEVYGVWLAHIISRKAGKKQRRVVVAVDVAGDGDGGGQSLVTKKDLFKFVLENSFNAAIRSFLSLYGIDIKRTSDGKVVSKVLQLICDMPVRPVDSWATLAEWVEIDIDRMGLEDFLRSQIGLWCQALGHENKLTTSEYSLFCNAPLYRKFIEYVCGPIIEQANTFLAKYEEDFSTLPDTFKAGDGDRKENTNKDIDIGSTSRITVEFTSNAQRREALHRSGAVCYFRHDKFESKHIAVYREALSGSQGYLTNFQKLKEDVDKKTVPLDSKRFLVSLVENAMSHILIIDERVKDFVETHPEVDKKLGGLGIAVMSDADEAIVGLFKCFSSSMKKCALGERTDAFKSKVMGVVMGLFDILIIHQGIIDKLLADHENREQVGDFLKMLIKKIHYVVVTTGRGTPANIPEEARILPYSVIEDTILKCYPEKLVLVDAVMNVLPIMSKKGV